jgi:hypothetical protein
MEENRIPKRVLYTNLESTRPRGRPRNRWQEEVRENVRIVGGEEWQEKVYDREERKKLLRMTRNRRILHIPKEQNRTELIIQYAVWGREKAYIAFWWKNLRERDHLVDPGVEGRIILRCIFRYWDVGYGLD